MLCQFLFPTASPVYLAPVSHSYNDIILNNSLAALIY